MIVCHRFGAAVGAASGAILFGRWRSRLKPLLPGWQSRLKPLLRALRRRDRGAGFPVARAGACHGAGERHAAGRGGDRCGLAPARRGAHQPGAKPQLERRGLRARYFQIRGTGELEQYDGAPNPSVGFVIDDIDLSGIGAVATTFDLEGIEVLRGPQGVRYGANALAGLIYVQSKEPIAAARWRNSS